MTPTTTQREADPMKFSPAVPYNRLSEDDQRARDQAKAEVKRMNEVRNFPADTDPCSRHVALMAECLAKGKPYPMLDEEREHCAISLAATVAMLWEARAKICELEAAALRQRKAL